MKSTMIILVIAVTVLSLCLSSLAQQRAVTQPAPKQQPAIQPQPVPKAPTIDPAMLRRLQAPVARATMINTLMANPTTRAELENLAKTAKIRVSELSIKTLGGSPVSSTPQGQLIDQLNWNAGIKISMIRNRPTFFHPQSNSTRSVGRISIYGVHLWSENISQQIENDVFETRQISLDLNLPLTPAPYLIAIHSSDRPSEMTISDRNPSRKIQNIVPLSSGAGFVALTTIVPHVYMEGINICAINVGYFIGSQNLFGGFTITRL